MAVGVYPGRSQTSAAARGLCDAWGRNEGVALIPGGSPAAIVVPGLGAAAAAFATVVSMIPPTGSANPTLFLVKGIGGCALVFAVGIVLCRQGRRRMLRFPS